MTRILALLGRLAVAAGAVLALFAVTLVAAPPAHASTTNCAMYGTPLTGWGVRNGQFCASIEGQGTYIWRVTGNFGASWPGRDQVCNPSMKIDIYDRYGHWITWRQGTQKTGCFYGTWNSVNTINVQWDFPQAKDGYARVTLQSYGNPVVAVQAGLH